MTPAFRPMRLLTPNDTYGQNSDDRLVGYLLQRGFLGPARTVLDFGAGVGHLASAIQSRLPRARVICIEADPDANTVLRANGLSALPSLDAVIEPVDVAIMVEVIEHLPDPVGVLRQMAKVLRPGGELFITTPCGETRRRRRPRLAYETAEHVQFFTEQSLQLALLMSGFKPASFLIINELARPGEGMGQIKAQVKNVLRPVRAQVLGSPHLAGFSSLTAEDPS